MIYGRHVVHFEISASDSDVLDGFDSECSTGKLDFAASSVCLRVSKARRPIER